MTRAMARDNSQAPSLSGEPTSTFAAAVLDDGAPGAGPHAGAISVLSLTTSNIRLVRTLHDEVRSPNAGEPWGRTRAVYRGAFRTHRRRLPEVAEVVGRENSPLVAKQQIVGFSTVPYTTRENDPS